MKKVFLATFLAIGTIAFAQERKMGYNDLTPEQKTELRVKQMTLDLDLSDSQQKQLKTLFLKENKEREAKRTEFIALKEKGEKPTKDERFRMKSERLDKQIEMKSKLRKILNEKQMAKWEKKQSEKNMMSSKRKMEHRRKK